MKEIDLHCRVEQLKAELESTPGYSIRRCFKAIDEINNKYFDEAALRRFMKKIGHNPTKNELVAILRRFDLEGDCQVSFPEFCEALTAIHVRVQNHTRHSCERLPALRSEYEDAKSPLRPSKSAINIYSPEKQLHSGSKDAWSMFRGGEEQNYLVERKQRHNDSPLKVDESNVMTFAGTRQPKCKSAERPRKALRKKEKKENALERSNISEIKPRQSIGSVYETSRFAASTGSMLKSKQSASS